MPTFFKDQDKGYLFNTKMKDDGWKRLEKLQNNSKLKSFEEVERLVQDKLQRCKRRSMTLHRDISKDLPAIKEYVEVAEGNREASCWEFKNVDSHDSKKISRNVLLKCRSCVEDEEQEIRFTAGGFRNISGESSTNQKKEGHERDNKSTLYAVFRRFATEQDILLPLLIFLPCILMDKPLYRYV